MTRNNEKENLIGFPPEATTGNTSVFTGYKEMQRGREREGGGERGREREREKEREREREREPEERELS